eukprot:5062045-Prymnesium_polylepis.1
MDGSGRGEGAYDRNSWTHTPSSPCIVHDIARTAARRRHRRAAQAAQAVAAGTAGETAEAGGKPPPAVISIGGDGPAAAGGTDGYKLVVNRRRGARALKVSAKEAVERAPAGRLRVHKSGRAAEGNNQYDGRSGEGRWRLPRLRGVRRTG